MKYLLLSATLLFSLNTLSSNEDSNNSRIQELAYCSAVMTHASLTINSMRLKPKILELAGDFWVDASMEVKNKYENLSDGIYFDQDKKPLEYSGAQTKESAEILKKMSTLSVDHPYWEKYVEDISKTHLHVQDSFNLLFNDKYIFELQQKANNKEISGQEFLDLYYKSKFADEFGKCEKLSQTLQWAYIGNSSQEK
ncbi:hypothetical protein N9I84_01385 [Gammaproteobacteria bacterium]|jgi:hypothetical protein|nr:hypothetical protein [Gammaproteobacteria bacterium]MDA9834484.1 hypothetical protein [Gammaproteobacteria bacterium]MDA9979188.1 hypothetical protein [Gammaproteobacteria bacterium]